MQAFVGFMFWYLLVGVVVHLIMLAVEEWPRERKEESLGEHLALTIFACGLFAWVCVVRYLN